jgi:hypothetical protein
MVTNPPPAVFPVLGLTAVTWGAVEPLPEPLELPLPLPEPDDEPLPEPEPLDEPDPLPDELPLPTVTVAIATPAFP